jgi:hypothetical protein
MKHINYLLALFLFLFLRRFFTILHDPGNAETQYGNHGCE